MPHYRKLYTKTVESLDVNDMSSDFVRLMWVLLPLKCCREGRGLFHTTWLKSNLFPLRTDVSDEMIMSAMKEFSSLNMIQVYEVDQRKYFKIRQWHKYQGNTSREAESIYPEPPDDESIPPDNSTRDKVASSSREGIGGGAKNVYASASIDVSKGGIVKGGDEIDDKAGEIFTFFENNICLLNAYISDLINDAINEHGLDTVLDATKEAAGSGAKTWNYVDKILKRWAREGRDKKPKVSKQVQADNLISLVRKYGRFRYQEAEPKLIEAGLLNAVKGMGGWGNVCRMNESQIPFEYYKAMQ